MPCAAAEDEDFPKVLVQEVFASWVRYADSSGNNGILFWFRVVV